MTQPASAQIAPISRRAIGYLIDAFIAAGLAIVLFGGLVVAATLTGPEGMLTTLLIGGLIVSLLLLGWFVVYTLMQAGKGSIGMRAQGLRLVMAGDQAPLGFGRALLRNIIFALTCSVVVGYFTPLFDSSGRRQGWHDMAARTVVVDVRKTDAAPRVDARPATANPYLPPPTGAAPLPPAPPLQPAAPLPSPGFMPAVAGTAVRPAPAVTRPAAPIGTGLIDGVPWVTQDPQPSPVMRPPQSADSFPSVTMPFPAATTTEPLGTAAMVAVAPAAAAPAAPLATPAVSSPAAAAPDDDLDSTRIVVPPPAQRAPLYDGAPVIAVLTWDDGARMAVYGRTLYGRNPANEQGAVAIAVRDETLSLSKTHFEVGGDSTGAWIVDRHSTNGTTLVRDGGRIPLVPGVRTNLRAGDGLEFGDRRVTVSAP